jgi:hypothetical protein
MNSFLAQTEAEEALDNLSVDVPMTEAHKFMLISGEEGEDGMEGQANGAAEVAPIADEYYSVPQNFIILPFFLWIKG